MRNNRHYRGVQVKVKLTIALILCGTALLAQTSEVELRLATAGGQSRFRLGETIPLELSFTSPVTGKYTISIGNGDRNMLEDSREEIRVAPAVGDPLAEFFRSGGGSFLSGVAQLSSKPVVAQKDLNQWRRFDRPGRYRVSVVSRRVTADRKPFEVTSNEIEIELVDDPEWRAGRAAEAARILRTVPKSGESSVFRQRMEAARQLWYLDTPESVRESARLLDGTDVQVDHILQLGLWASSRKALAIEVLQGLLTEPSHPAAPVLLQTLATLKTWVEIPPQTPDMARQRMDRQAAIAVQLQDELSAHIEQKQGAAKAVSLHTVLAAGSPDAISAGQRTEMAALFSSLPPDRQADLLNGEWNRIAGPAMIPVLRKLYDSLPESAAQTSPPAVLAASAVRRLYELDPAQARPLIVAEMTRPNTRLPFATLSLLPDMLPEVEDRLVANLELGTWKSGKSETDELIARYASARVLDRVKAFYARVDATMRARPGTVGDPPRRLAMPACDPPLYAYFLRTDPAFGEKLLRQVMAERSFDMGNCWMRAIGETAGYFVNRQWEGVALDGLNDATVPVKIDAVKALGEHGSPAAVAPLLEAFRYWHDWWQDMPSEINEENRQLEAAYVRTLSDAANWISTGDDIARAAAFCITGGCRGQMAQTRQYWASGRLEASVGQASDGSFYFNLAQYSERSLEAARRRLLLLPQGTALLWKQTTWDHKASPALDLWTERVQGELQDRGVTVAR
jgi:hypothetical protein